VDALASPQFVGSEDGEFGEHDQDFVFGPDELKGLKIFFREPLPQTLAGNSRYLSTRTGNCIACHAAPNFTDFSFHNTGATQEEYDEAHGGGAFARLFIPDLAYRSAHPEEFLPSTEQHPASTGRFRSGDVDLGVWNVFANPDFPGPQAALNALLNPEGDPEDAVLRRTVGLFKTPGLRDLSQSGPYLHPGRMREIEEVVEFYISSATKARAGSLRNGSPALEGIFLGEGDIDPLAAFLRALNEDYN
jgi:cytochrome c peroxidase